MRRSVRVRVWYGDWCSGRVVDDDDDHEGCCCGAGCDGGSCGEVSRCWLWTTGREWDGDGCGCGKADEGGCYGRLCCTGERGFWGGCGCCWGCSDGCGGSVMGLSQAQGEIAR